MFTVHRAFHASTQSLYVNGAVPSQWMQPPLKVQSAKNFFYNTRPSQNTAFQQDCFIFSHVCGNKSFFSTRPRCFFSSCKSNMRYHLCLLFLVRLGGYIENLSDLYSYRLIHLKRKVGLTLTKATALRITLNLDGSSTCRFIIFRFESFIVPTIVYRSCL